MWPKSKLTIKASPLYGAAPEADVPHKSIVVWPAEVSCGNADNSSVDTHRSKEAAEAVCRGVMREGLGGEGKIFPISVQVEPV